MIVNFRKGITYNIIQGRDIWNSFVSCVNHGNESEYRKLVLVVKLVCTLCGARNNNWSYRAIGVCGFLTHQRHKQLDRTNKTDALYNAAASSSWVEQRRGCRINNSAPHLYVSLSLSILCDCNQTILQQPSPAATVFLLLLDVASKSRVRT